MIQEQLNDINSNDGPGNEVMFLRQYRAHMAKIFRYEMKL